MTTQTRHPIDRLSIWIGKTFSYVYLILIAVMVYEVTARYLFDAPTIWAHEVSGALIAVGFTLGGVYTMQQKGHISISSVYELMPPRWKAALDVFAQVVTLVFLAAFIWGAGVNALKAWELGETSGSAWNQPTPIFLKTLVVIGAALMCLQAGVHLAQAVRRSVSRTEQA